MGSSVIIKCFFLDRQSEKVLPKGRLHTVDLLSINRLDQLLFILKMFMFLFTQHNEEVDRTETSLSVRAPWGAVPT